MGLLVWQVCRGFCVLFIWLSNVFFSILVVLTEVFVVHEEKKGNFFIWKYLKCKFSLSTFSTFFKTSIFFSSSTFRSHFVLSFNQNEFHYQKQKWRLFLEQFLNGINVYEKLQRWWVVMVFVYFFLCFLWYQFKATKALGEITKNSVREWNVRSRKVVEFNSPDSMTR